MDWEERAKLQEDFERALQQARTGATASVHDFPYFFRPHDARGKPLPLPRPRRRGPLEFDEFAVAGEIYRAWWSPEEDAYRISHIGRVEGDREGPDNSWGYITVEDNHPEWYNGDVVSMGDWIARETEEEKRGETDPLRE